MAFSMAWITAHRARRARRSSGMVDPAHPPSRRAPLRWAIGGVVPWLLLAAGQVVWIAFDHRTALAAYCGRRPHGARCGDLAGRRAAVAVSGTPVGDRPAGGVHPHGWLVQERRIAPISRVQTVDTYRGPLDRLFGLANVTVTTASSAGAVHIAALDVAVADHMVAQLTDIAAIGAEDAT